MCLLLFFIFILFICTHKNLSACWVCHIYFILYNMNPSFFQYMAHSQVLTLGVTKVPWENNERSLCICHWIRLRRGIPGHLLRCCIEWTQFLRNGARSFNPILDYFFSCQSIRYISLLFLYRALVKTDLWKAVNIWNSGTCRVFKAGPAKLQKCRTRLMYWILQSKYFPVS